MTFSRSGLSTIFTWIFVLVAGSLLVTLFYTVSTQQLSAAEERQARTALTQIDGLLSQQTPEEGARVNIPSVEMRLVCQPITTDDDVQLISELQIAPYTRSTETLLLAGQNQQTTELLLAHKQLRLPYNTGSVLLVSSEEELLVIENDELREEINESLPEILRGQLTEQAPSNVQQYTTVRYLHVDKTSNPDRASNEYDIAIDFDSPNNLYRGGTISYYEDEDWTDAYDFAGDAMLLGLIWQAQPAPASCLQHKLSDAIQRQAQAHLERVRRFRNAYQGTSCEARYTEQALRNLNNTPQQIGQENPLYTFPDLSKNALAVHRQNEAMLRGERCATIY